MSQDGRVAVRSGDAQAEHVAGTAEVAATGMQFVQDPVLAGLVNGHPHRGGDPLGADRGAVQCGAPANEDVGVPRRRPALFTVGQPDGKPVPDRFGQWDGALVQMEAPVVDAGGGVTKPAGA